MAKKEKETNIPTHNTLNRGMYMHSNVQERQGVSNNVTPSGNNLDDEEAISRTPRGDAAAPGPVRAATIITWTTMGLSGLLAVFGLLTAILDYSSMPIMYDIYSYVVYGFCGLMAADIALVIVSLIKVGSWIDKKSETTALAFILKIGISFGIAFGVFVGFVIVLLTQGFGWPVFILAITFMISMLVTGLMFTKNKDKI